MPKNKKPAGGRPAQNFEPRYGDKPAFQDRKRRTDDARPAARRKRRPVGSAGENVMRPG